MRRTSESESETESIAADVALSLMSGDCLALFGDLGAGKTNFVRGLVKALGGEARVSSPTFVLLNIYPTAKFTIFHLDAYRVNEQDFEAIGFPELLAQNQIVVVEWAGRVEKLLPKRRIEVRFEVLSENVRKISIERIGVE